MGLLLLLLAGIIVYLYATGRLTTHLLRYMGAGALGLFALRYLLGGKMLPGLALAAVGIALAFWGNRPRLRVDELSVEEARDILGVPAGASPDEIRAAHRRIVAQVHPDKGGSAYLAQRVNAARDILLRQAGREPPGTA